MRLSYAQKGSQWLILQASMDQRVFDQLDVLERGARVETRPTRDVYNDSSAEFSAYGDPNAGYYEDDAHQQHPQYEEDEFADLPMTLDSFGKLHMPGSRFQR